MWIIYVSIVLLTIGYFSLSNKLKNIEGSRGKQYSMRFGIDFLHSVITNKMFGKLYGIKSAEVGKEFKDWTKEDKEKWYKISKELTNKLVLNIVYLQSEDAYFVKADQQSYFSLPELGNRSIYATELYESEDGESLDCYLCERYIQSEQISGKVITGYLREFDNKSNKKVTVLFDFPIGKTDMSDDDFKQLGYSVERYGGDDIYENDFGENSSIPTIITLSKNGSKITF